MGLLKHVAAIGLLLLASACSSDPPTEAAIRLTLDTSRPIAEGGCASASCTDYGMSCGATVLMRLTDPETGELLYTQSGRPLSVCRSADVNEDICSLSDLESEMVLDGMPAKTVRVEVAVWTADDVPVDEGCPAPVGFELFDVFGRPQTNFDPQPALAGATYFRAGNDTDVVVPIACANPALLDINTCAANLPTNVSAAVTDIGTMQPLRKEQAESVAVQAGVAVKTSDGQGGSFFVLVEDRDSLDLELDNGGATPIYRNPILLRFADGDPLACSTTREDVAQATTNVFCEQVDEAADALSLSPLLVRKPLLDTVLDALGLESFPESGLLIGRVVDQGFAPLPGVVVTPSDGTSVLYLNEDLSLAGQGLSSNSAFFVSTDVSFGASWTASHFNDGRRHSGQPRGGLVQGKLSTLVIRMTGDVVGD